jgi:hypothetical protein
MFYEKQKELYDICGNVINKDKYPFVDILSKYLIDIVGLIDIEIKNSARNSMINWREKKNPKLLSRLINSDENVNLINLSMNKITASNFMNIVNEISDALLNDNYRKLPDYCSFLFDVVIKKCMIDEAFAKDYIHFLFGFKDNIAMYLNENITKFINESMSFLTTNKALKDYDYFHYVRDVASWRNIGVIFSNIFKFISSSTLGNKGLPKVDIVNNLETQFEILFNILDWLPANMDELNSRLFMVFAILENVMDDIWHALNPKSQGLFKEILTLVYNCANIPNKIKFKVLDLQDMIKNKKVFNEETVNANSAVAVPVATAVIVDAPATAPAPAPAPAPASTNTNTNISVSKDISGASAVSSPINIWQARKQQRVSLNPAHNILTADTQPATIIDTLPSNKSSSMASNNIQRATNHNQNNNRESTESFRSKNKNRNDNGNKNISNKNASNASNVSNVISKSKNMFSGLESSDSNDEIQNKDNKNDDDGEFITVEKKTKNVYKPKKTPAFAIEGGKIYSNVSNPSSKAKATHSRRS